jgi:hypothetical protein
MGLGCRQRQEGADRDGFPQEQAAIPYFEINMTE